GSFERLHRGAVVVAVHGGPLREGVALAHGEEFGLRHEMEIRSVDLPGPRGSGGVGDGVEETGHELADLMADGGLPRSRGSGGPDQRAAPLDQLQLSSRLIMRLAGGSSGTLRLARPSALASSCASPAARRARFGSPGPQLSAEIIQCSGLAP